MESPIEAAEREIKRDSADLTRLKQRYPGYDFVRSDDSMPQSSSQPRQSRPKGSDLENAVLLLIDSDPTVGWTSRKVFDALTAQKYPLPENDQAARDSIYYALLNLRDTDKIIQLYEGRGRDPHRYGSKLAVSTVEEGDEPE